MEKFKYPKTYHLPWSGTINGDDRVLKSFDNFVGKRVIVTEKMDGENTTIYSNGYMHARSVDSKNHPSRNFVKNMFSGIFFNIPKGWRICGENLYAVHSIKYENLESYFYGFSIWDRENQCLSWDETVEYFKMLDVVHVPILYDGIFDEDTIKDLHRKMDPRKSEGYVIRLEESFDYMDFSKSIAKYVRENHLQTNKVWDGLETNKLNDYSQK